MRKVGELEGRVKELDAWGLRMMGFVFLLLTREYAKGKGGHTRKRMDMCGNPWKDRRTASL